MQCEICGEREATVVYVVGGDRIAAPPRRVTPHAAPAAAPTLCPECARARMPDFAKDLLAPDGRPMPWEAQPLGVARRALAAVGALVLAAFAVWAPIVHLRWWPAFSGSMGVLAVSAAAAAWRGRETVLYPRRRRD